jgi:PPOX class probable F420-dependent enzyme
VDLSPEVVALLQRPSPCFLATVLPDGAPQLTETWVGTDGRHVLINTVEGFSKTRNVARDPRIALVVCDPDAITRYVQIRGRVVAMTTDGAQEQLDELSHKYLGRPYPEFGGAGQVRVLLTIEADRVIAQGR